MKAAITQTRSISNPSRNKSGRSIVYVESPLNKVADDFASKHGIFGLRFKCKTWDKVCRQVNKTHVVELKKLFPEALSIKFSSTAGCRCGCSPGFIMKHEPNQVGKNFWVDLEASEAELALFKASINGPVFEFELREEIESHKAVPA